MNKFDRGNRFNSRDSGRPQMHKAVCANCGKDCEVPFRPTSNRPVYCSNCFKTMGGPSQHRSEDRDFKRSYPEKKRMFKVVCDNCGRDCEVPFQPSAGKPVYCNDCFGKSERVGSKKSDQSKEQFDAINAKLDKIINLLTKPVFEGVVKKEQTVHPKQESEKVVAKKAIVKKSKAKKKK